VIDELEGTPELDNELGLFNKVGDLHVKMGNVGAAVELYERAANRYAESGFPNNAIALCNKILRTSPGRTPVYLKLAKLMIDRGFISEAKRNLLEYAQRMERSGKLEEAFIALKEFADLSPNSDEIRLLLAEQLKQAARTDEARDQLAKLYAEVEARGDERKTRTTIERMKAVDPDFDAESEPRAELKKSGGRKKTSDLIFLDFDAPVAVEEKEEAPAPEPMAEAPEPEPEPEPEDLEIEPTAFGEEEFEVVETTELDIEPTAIGEDEEEAVEEVAAVDIDTTSLADDYGEPDDVEAVEEPAEMERTSVTDLEAEDVEELDEPEGVERTEDVLVVEGQEFDLGEDEGDAVIGEIEVQEVLEVEELQEVADVPEAESSDSFEVADLDLDGPVLLDTGDSDVSLDVPELEVDDLDLEVTEEPAETEDLAAEPESEGFDLGAAIAADLEDDASAVELVDVATLEGQVADDPDNAGLHRQLAESLLEAAERDRAFQELDVAIELFEQQDQWGLAESVADEALRLDPNSVKYHQKDVEYAFRRGEQDGLIDAYLGLADALFREGSTDRARAVYQRILERDPGNDRAKLQVETLAAAPEPESPPEEAATATADSSGGEEYVDLGALLFEDEPATKKKRMDPRMRIREEEPTGDEERDFAEMLSAFKKGIEENISDEDWQSHYDLGVAFKEMGLLDEAITEFQKALRASQGRLRTAESLGLCFFEKGQFSVAGTVLRRAIDAEDGSDEAKIALLYWLGRCEEEQARQGPALECYQRVFSVDVGFEDVQDRVKSLAGAAGK